MFTFERLDVWQKAIGFADLVYNQTRHFPPEERFGLTNQMRRAAVSISSNIAEGTSRMSQTDFARFIEIATVRFLRSSPNRSSVDGKDSSQTKLLPHCIQRPMKSAGC
jgi:hypothetical protein